MSLSSLLARTGEVIHDKNGAIFATVARDIHRGQTMHPNDIVFTDGRKPVFGEVIPQPVLDVLNGRIGL